MAFGLPAVCSNFGHMQTYTEKNKTGLTVNPADPQDICSKLIQLKTDNELYTRLSENGIKAAKVRFNWEMMEKRLKDIYKTLISEHVYSNQR
jgi:glycosyltransferase involved in cell wall biosynthesis